MDIRHDYDAVGKVCSPKSANTWWEIRTNWRWAINTWTLPSCAGKLLWLQALKYPVESELTSFIQSRSSLLPGHWTSAEKSSPLERNIRVCSEHNTGECRAGPGLAASTATWEEPLHLLIGFNKESGSFFQVPQTPLRCPCSTVRTWFWQPPA